VKLRDVLGWDLWLALAGTAAIWWFLPEWPRNSLAKELYEMGLSVLSIVFAVFFTALAVMIASGDDDFVGFLRELGIYEGIVQTFRYTLIVLFIALMAAVVLFAFTAISIDMGYKLQSKYALVTFGFLFLYSLFAVAWSTHDSLEYSKRRIQYTEVQRAVRTPPNPEA
jgi:hypothetical protein